MMDLPFWLIKRSAGYFLLLGTLAGGIGITMFLVRGGLWGGLPSTSAYFVWERGSIIASVVLTVIGFMLIEGSLQNTAGYVLARVGAAGYLFAGIMGVAAEALGLVNKEQDLYPLIVLYVVLALLAQASFGGSFLQSGLLPVWIGWMMILWNLAWLVVLPLTTPNDIYYPVLHQIMPLLISIALLRRGSSR